MKMKLSPLKCISTSHTSSYRTAAPAMAAVIAFGLQLAFTGPGYAQDGKPTYLFVQVAKDLKVDPDAKTLRLVNVGQQTVFFSDRPFRDAGHTDTANYLTEWTAKAGSDNFGGDPPNAVLSVINPGQADSTFAIVEISDPKMDGADLVYAFKLLDGQVPTDGGSTTLVIDEINFNHSLNPADGPVGATTHSDR